MSTVLRAAQYSTHSVYVSARLRRFGRRRPAAEVFVPQIHRPGAEAEDDFAELCGDLPAGRGKCYLFMLRLCLRGRAVHRLFVTQS